MKNVLKMEDIDAVSDYLCVRIHSQVNKIILTQPQPTKQIIQDAN